MEHSLAKVVGKPNDYKICLECGIINWYENKECHQCLACVFSKEITDEGMEKWADEEYRFWKKEGWTESEIDDLLIEI